MAAPIITRETVQHIVKSCQAHGSCTEEQYQEGVRLAARTVDSLIVFALGKPIHHIEVSWQSEIDMVAYVACDAAGDALSSVCVRDSVLPCATAALAGFVYYCQETRGIPCDLVPEIIVALTNMRGGRNVATD